MLELGVQCSETSIRTMEIPPRLEMYISCKVHMDNPDKTHLTGVSWRMENIPLVVRRSMARI